MPFKEALPIILRMVEAGNGPREIGEATGRAPAAIQAILNRRGIGKGVQP